MTTSARVNRVDQAIRSRDRSDRWSWIRDATDAHRRRHNCWAYPYEDGSVLGAIVEALQPERVLELGTALGYTACWWAGGGAHVDTVENDPVHVALARDNVGGAALADAITVHEGNFDAVVPSLGMEYDLVFFDGYEPPAALLDIIGSALRPGGVLVTTNLDLDGGRFRRTLDAAPGWNTHLVKDLALSIRG